MGTKANEIEKAHAIDARSVTMRVATLYRCLMVFVLYMKTKVARRMGYYHINVKDWQEAKRNEQGLLSITTDKFKTSNTYTYDTLLFPKECEQRINFYLQACRPVLAEVCDCDWLALCSIIMHHP